MDKAQQIAKQICDYYGIHIGMRLLVSPRFHKHLKEDRKWGYDIWDVDSELIIISMSPAQYRDEVDHPENPSFQVNQKGGATTIYLADVIEMKHYKERKLLQYQAQLSKQD